MNYTILDFFSEKALKDDRASRATGLCNKLVGHFSHMWKKKDGGTQRVTIS